MTKPIYALPTLPNKLTPYKKTTSSYQELVVFHCKVAMLYMLLFSAKLQA